MGRGTPLALAHRVRSIHLLAFSILLVSAAAPAFAAASTPASVPASTPASGWRPVEGPARRARLVAVAVHPDGRLAAADAGGVWMRGADTSSWRRVTLRGPLRDVAWSQDGSLWAAGEQGVWRLPVSADPVSEHPGAGERDRFVTRLASAGPWLAAAGEAGVFVRRGRTPWQRVREGLPNAPATAIGFSQQVVAAHPFELWASVSGRLHRVALNESGPAPAQRVPLAGAGAGEPLADLGSAGGGGMLAIGARWLAGGPEWRTERLGLPPGVEARRVAFAGGAVAVATARGVYRFARADAPGAAPLAPLAAPSGRRAVNDLAVAGGTLYAASEEGLFELRPRTAAPATAGPGVPALRLVERPEPGVRTVQMAALAYLGLGPGRMRSLRRGVDRRGWLPELQLRAEAGTGRDTDRDLDRAFTSGALRELLDERVVRTRDYGVMLTLSWDLGDAAFHPESIDVSREARAVVELRDDVLDEVNRLYFERLRVLASLDTADPKDAVLLHLRAAELAAGLDAWTGGWFGRHLGPAVLSGTR